MSSNIWHESIMPCSDDIFLCGSTRIAGNIVLIDCHPRPDYYIHKFGRGRSDTENYNPAMGLQVSLRW